MKEGSSISRKEIQRLMIKFKKKVKKIKRGKSGLSIDQLQNSWNMNGGF